MTRVLYRSMSAADAMRGADGTDGVASDAPPPPQQAKTRSLHAEVGRDGVSHQDRAA